MIKKSVTILLILMIFVVSLLAQNLVPNSNFSMHSQCPTNYGQIDYCASWRNATKGTVDYFHACSPGTYFGVPGNSLGYQNSPSGAMVGFICYGWDTNYREYPSITIPPLVIGAKYKVSIRVSRAEGTHVASDGLGIFFFKDVQLDTSTAKCLNYTPQIDYSSYGIIKDTLNWVTLTDSFFADSAYSQLAIGNFKSDSDGNTWLDSSSWSNRFAYYYVDSVSVDGVSKVSVDKIENATPEVIFPNPFKDFAMISVRNNKYTSYSIFIYNLYGRLVRTQQVSSGTTKFERDRLPSGIYFYHLTNEDTIISRGRLIIE